jgi:hypothetical protein
MPRDRKRLVIGTLLACTACANALADQGGGAAQPDDDRPLVTTYSIRSDLNRTLFGPAPAAVGWQPAPQPRRDGAIRAIAGRPDELVWRIGPQVVRPVRSEDPLGDGTWRAGVASVALAIEGVRVYSALASERCALSGELDRGKPNGFLIQPFVNYNLADGWYLASAPVIRADWTAAGGQKWTVPLGASIGRLGRLGDWPLSVQAGFYQNVERPEGESDWALRLEMRLAFSP